jgi:serine/threonine protein kinase
MTKFYPIVQKDLQRGKFIRVLGEGGFGKIFLYDFKKSNQKIVVKQVHSHSTKEFLWKIKNIFRTQERSPKTLKRELLFHEYKIGVQLDHPFIRKTFDYDDKTPCLFLEYLEEYIDLYDFLVDCHSKISLQEKFVIFTNIVKAVEYMHSKFIAHLDIKPENIMIHPRTLDIKLIDFGKSFQWKKNNKNIALKNIVSSYGYMAPEEFIEEEELNPEKLDTWSLGLVFYCILYNMFPWDIAKDSDKRFHKHATFIKCNMISSSLFYDLPLLSKNRQDLLKTIFQRTLHTEPDHRINISQLHHLLNQLTYYH